MRAHPKHRRPIPDPAAPSTTKEVSARLPAGGKPARSPRCGQRAGTVLRESEKRYRTLFDAIDQGFCVIEVIFDERNKPIDYRFLETNPAFERQTGQVGATGRRVRELAPNHGEHWFETFGKIALTGQPARFQRWAETLHRWYDVYAFRFGRPEDRQVAVLFSDVTVHKAMEEDLHRRAEELQTVLESVPALVWIAHDPDCRRVTGNRLADELLRLPHGAEASLTAPKGQRPTHFQVLKDGRVLAGEDLPVQRAARGEVVTDFDFSVAFDDGTVRHVLGNAMPLFDREGRTRGAVSAFIDVTERKAMEEDLRASLEEKDVLMRELAHRTKNNMQVIAGLLDLQAAKVSDEKFRDVLSDTKNRIRAMALVHEKLYGSGNVSRLNMKEYVEDLAASLLFAHQGSDGRVKLNPEVGDFSLSVDSALPCGLIINELIANSLKHAFPGLKTGTICLSLLSTGKEFVLTYRDDGPGLPEGLDPFRVSSLGLKLVYNLAVRQLRGTMDIRRDPATEFLFRFRDFDLVKRG